MDSHPGSLGRGGEHSLLDCACVYLRLVVDPVCGFVLRDSHAEIGKDHVPRGRENGTAIAVDIGAHAHDMIFSHHLVLFIDWFDFSLSILYPCIFRSCGQDVCSVVLTWLDHVVSHFQAAFQHSWPIVLFFSSRQTCSIGWSWSRLVLSILPSIYGVFRTYFRMFFWIVAIYFGYFICTNLHRLSI